MLEHLCISTCSFVGMNLVASLKVRSLPSACSNAWQVEVYRWTHFGHFRSCASTRAEFCQLINIVVFAHGPEAVCWSAAGICANAAMAILGSLGCIASNHAGHHLQSDRSSQLPPECHLARNIHSHLRVPGRGHHVLCKSIREPLTPIYPAFLSHIPS